ncbi:hypothetical protein C2E23DRAFT_376222 [Lenzites betulinus]|nr:hypothetical protein C2E23DRAFT_376222 [Lenzites betulinus]
MNSPESALVHFRRGARRTSGCGPWCMGECACEFPARGDGCEAGGTRLSLRGHENARKCRFSFRRRTRADAGGACGGYTRARSQKGTGRGRDPSAGRAIHCGAPEAFARRTCLPITDDSDRERTARDAWASHPGVAVASPRRRVLYSGSGDGQSGRTREMWVPMVSGEQRVFSDAKAARMHAAAVRGTRPCVERHRQQYGSRQTWGGAGNDWLPHIRTGTFGLATRRVAHGETARL